MTNKGQHWQIGANAGPLAYLLTLIENWQIGANAGPLAYLLTLIENLASGAWRENCKQYEGRPR